MRIPALSPNARIRQATGRYFKKQRAAALTALIWALLLALLVLALAVIVSLALRLMPEAPSADVTDTAASTSMESEHALQVFCPDAGATPAKPETVEIRVLNTTQQNGLARRTADELTRRGFKVGAVSNAPAKEQGVVLRYGPSGYLAAKAVSAQFNQVKEVLEQRDDNRVDILLGDEFKGLREQTAALTILNTPVEKPSKCMKP